MKKIILFTSLILGGAAFAQNVNIPDANFKAYLVGNTSINTNADTSIQVSEALAYFGPIICANMNISDLTGIEAFPNITYLLCNNNNISALDLSQNTAISELSCQNNLLSDLDVSQNTALTTLSCYNNQIDSLDVTQNTQLLSVSAGGNQMVYFNIGANSNVQQITLSNNSLSAIDLTQCPGLITLYLNNNVIGSLDVTQNLFLRNLQCPENNMSSIDLSNSDSLTQLDLSYTNITALDLSNNLKLINFNCNGNNISQIDLSQNSLLKVFNCSDSQFTDLDLSSNPVLNDLNCANNQLVSLNIANGNNTNMYINATGNINLGCIQVDDSTYSANNWSGDIHPSSYFSENCSGAVGLNEQEVEVLSVYPNPCFDRLNIEGTVLSVEVYDLSGKVVQSEQTNSFSVENLKKGMYLIKIETPDGLRRAQFIKQ